jgi:selenocysteine-specific elongation factor
LVLVVLVAMAALWLMYSFRDETGIEHPFLYHARRMKSVIVGTAGHIDHGKTALVKALTGIDADRLEEEKRRGITIDIGFAHLDLTARGGEILRLGFVDVPGHERFVHNMLAGAGGIDLVLLVIAANESIKPQTREHFDICRLLAVRRGLVVLTKSDLVDRETLDVARLEVQEFLRRPLSGNAQSAEFAKWPIIPASSLTGAGLDDVRRALTQAAEEVPAKDSSALARLPIDRVFSMKGFGTVVTGTLIAGTVRKEDELEVHPTGKRLRVRGIQVHGALAESAVAGQRSALNLASIAKEDLARGMVLAPPGVFHPTSRLDAMVVLLASANPLKDRARVHLHAYTWETVATVALLDKKQVEPGQSALAQLRLADPTLLLPGDRFILRQFSPLVTIGGGIVLDAMPQNRKTQRERVLEFLKSMESGSPEEVLAARAARHGKSGLSIQRAMAETGWRPERITQIGEALAKQRRVIRAGNVFITADSFSAMVSEILQSLEVFHENNPLVPGISREAFREHLALETEIFAAVLDELNRAKKLEVTGDLVRLPGRGVVLKDEDAESKKIIEDAFASAGLKVPALPDVLAGLKIDRVRAQKIVTLLLRDKILVKLSGELVFHSDALRGLRERLSSEKKQSARIDVTRFKDLAGVSRKYAIPLLEYLDREHVTRRVGNEREIL